jgi:hypothetical protein
VNASRREKVLECGENFPSAAFLVSIFRAFLAEDFSGQRITAKRNNSSRNIRRQMGRPISVMRKAGYGYLAVALVLMLLAVFVFLASGAGLGALPREMAFTGGLHNSLSYLDQAKWKWAEEKHKSEGDIPTMGDLAPYLGDWTNSIKRFVACGIEYKITPISEMEPQSDVATFTRDVSFQIGFCRFYRAGTRYCIHTGWAIPQSGSGSWFLAFYQNNRGLLVIVLFTLAMGNLLVFVIKKIRNFREVRSISHEHQNA